MTNLRNKALAVLTAVTVLTGSALASSTAAQAGSKTDLAKAIVGGIVVGAIIGANANQPRPVVVQQRRHNGFGGPRFGQRRHHGGFGHQQAGFRDGGFRQGGCFTKEVVTIDQWGNRASSIRQICN